MYYKKITIILLILLSLMCNISYVFAGDSFVAQWTMDIEDNGYVLDLNNYGLSLKLDEDRTANGFINQPSVTDGCAGFYGEALYFPGLAVARANPFWNASFEAIKINFWMKVENFPNTAASNTAYLITSSGVFSLYFSNSNRLYFAVYNNSNTYLNGSQPCMVILSGLENQWLHVAAEFDKDTQHITLTVKDSGGNIIGTQMQSVGAALNQRTVDVHLGGWIGKPAQRSFNGWIDSVAISSGSTDDPDVALLDIGADVVISNGIVEMTVQKENARITSLKKGGIELLGGGGVGYWSNNTNGSYTEPSGAVYSVVTNQPDIVEIKLAAPRTEKNPFAMDYHFVLQRGDSGFYAFTAYEFDGSITPFGNLEQTRLGLRVDPSIFTVGCVDEGRFYSLPTPLQVASGTTLDPAEGILLDDGTIDYKYSLSKMEVDNHLIGLSGDSFGLWIISPTAEYLNGGPEKQNLTVHQTTTTPIAMKMLQSGHYGSGTLGFTEEDGVWRKIYGPWFVYLNNSLDVNGMWDDAKMRVADEMTKWPYEWMTHPLFKNKENRGTLQGQLLIADGSSPQDALVILAKPQGNGMPHWQQQGKDYILWSKADSSGNFVIYNVISGDYTMHVVVSGIMDEFILNNISIADGQVTDIGQVSWKPKKYGRKAWDIGIADRDANEFYRGDIFRDFGTWLLYPTDFPSNISYTIGQSDYTTNWNYFHPARDGGNGIYLVCPWMINFNMDSIPAGLATLRIGLAGNRSGRLQVNLGRYLIGTTSGLIEGAGSPRAGSRGYYQEVAFPFSTGLLKKGANSFTFQQTVLSKWSFLEYDYIRLELPYVADMDKNLEVELNDLGIFATSWLLGTTAADFNKDSKVDFSDFSILAREWGK